MRNVLSRTALSSPAFMADPGPMLALLHERGHAPVVRVPLLGRVTMPIGHGSVRAVLKDDETFRLAVNDRPAGLAWWMPRSIHLLADNMLGRDGAAHRRLRKPVDGPFAPGSLRDRESAIERTMDALCDEAVRGGSSFDLATAIARPLPLAVICDMLGLGDDDRAAFARQAESFGRMRGFKDFLRVLPAVRGMTRTLNARIADVRRGEGGDGLIAALVRAETDGPALKEDEVTATVFLLLVAGHETTTHLISGSVLLLLQEGLWNEPWLSELGARSPQIEELLRHVSPVQTVKPRHAMRAIEIEGTEIAKGSLVMPLLAAANRDPAIYDEPDRFVPDRFANGGPSAPLPFGAGPHFCLGHQLARMELAIALRTLATRFPDLRLDGAPVYNPRFGIRGLASLPVATQ